MTELLERDGALAVLRDALADAADRRGSIVLVAGDAGIGKSSLVTAFSEDPGHDARVMVGWCDDLLTSRTYGPLRDIARKVGGPLADAIQQADTSGVMEALFGLLEDPLRPAVLILEDLHWADEATLDVVRFVGRRITNRAGVLVLTYRPDELGVDHPLRGVLGALPSAAVHRISLAPLSRGAIEQLMADSELDADEVAALTGGNPFFVTEITAHGRLPASVTDAVVARLRSLPVGAQVAVETLSVLPRAVRREAALKLVDDPADLATAEARGLLVGAGVAVGFRHELARRAVLSALPATARSMHHGRVLDLLIQEGAEPAAILHQAMGAGRGDVVARFGPRAVHDAFEACANREVVSHAEQVLRFEELLDAAVASAVLEDYAWSLYNLGRFHAALHAAERAVLLRAQDEDKPAHARAVLTAARMAYMTNDPARCLELIDAAEELIEDNRHRADVVAEIHVNRAAVLHLVERHEAAIAEADKAAELVTTEDRADLCVLIAVYRGGSRLSLGDLEGLEEIRSATRFRRTKTNIEPIARCFTNLVEWLVGFRRWEDAAQTVDEALAYYDDHEFQAHRFNTIGQLAWMHLLMGRWDRADEVLHSLQPTSAGGEIGVLEAIPLGARALLTVRSGAEDAEEAIEGAWAVALRSTSPWYVVPTACAAIEHAWSSGRPELADRYIAAGLEASGESAWRDWLYWRMGILLGREIDPAVMTIAAERSGIADGWAAGATSWERLGMPYEQALELIRSGEPEPTLRGLALLDELGAEPAARIARQRLRDLGVRSIPRGPQPATRANPMGLTDRQLEVLELVADGLTNAEIAERLVVSIRTVDHHVSAILQKLGVTSRQDAAQVAQTLAGA